MKFLKSVLLIVIAAGSCLAWSQATKADADKDPAYQQLKRIVGGTWSSKVGKMEVTAKWRFGSDGSSIMGDTTVAPGTKDEFRMNARFGWDPEKKQPYYLDCHGLDTIYFGHASLEGEDTLLTFKGLVGQGPDNGTYVFRIHWKGADSYHATLSYIAEGKEPKVVENFDWMRKAE